MPNEGRLPFDGFIALNNGHFHESHQIHNNTHMKNERILIVEDEQAMRVVLGDALGRQGYRVLSAVNGADGLDMALRDQPDLMCWTS